jgi:hypothetical protein
MAWEIFGLLAIPLGIGAILSVSGVKLVRVLTDPHRNPRELIGAGVGLFVGGSIGLIGSGLAAFLCGLLPFLGSRGHPIAASVVVFGGVVGLGLLGARVGQVLGRRVST